MKIILASIVCLASVLLPACVRAQLYTGNFESISMPTYNVLAYGALGDGLTDDTAAFQAAITAAATPVGASCGGTIFVPKPHVKYLLLSGLTVPYTTGSFPVQCPVRITGDLAAQNGYWATSPVYGGSILDMQYTGSDGLYKAKIDTRGAGVLEIDHLMIEDTASDNFPFIQTTNTTLYDHDNAFVGNPSCFRASCTQDVLRLGQNGYTVTGSIASGSSTLTADSSVFTSAMVGWTTVIYGSESTTIASYISPTQVTVANASPTTVSHANVNYYGAKTSDSMAPFQGYGTVISRNYYSHIQRAIIWGTYANNVEVDNETISNTCGSGLPLGAPYYFEANSNVQDGSTIRGGTIEISGYPYVISLQGFQHGNMFDAQGTYDNVGATLGVVYFNANATNNTVIEGQVDSIVGQNLMAGPGAYYNTDVNNGTGNISSDFVYAVNATGPAARGHAYQIDGKDVLYSNSVGSSDTDLNLQTPGSIGSVHLYENDGVTGAALTAGSIKTTGNTSSFNGWNFNPISSTDFYWGSSSTTAATLHFRTNGYTNGDTATLNSGGSFLAVGTLGWKNGPTISSGSGAPSGACTSGSLYTRTDSSAAAGSELYVCRNVSGVGTWEAVSGG